MGSPPAFAEGVTIVAALLCASAAANPTGGPHMADLSVLLPPRRQSLSSTASSAGIDASPGQTEEVEVSYDTGEKAEPPSSWGLTTSAVMLTCIIVTIVTVAVFMKLLQRPTRQAPSRNMAASTPARAPAANPAAMADPVSPANGQFSPRTPQPCMEYVRRTIDDTPYYKRDARRRFNPQNTY